MFQGTVSVDLRNIIAGIVKGWRVNSSAVAYSSDFTIERCLSDIENISFKSCDYNLFSMAIGSYLTGTDFRLNPNEDYAGIFPFLGSRLSSLTEKTASVLVADGLKHAFNPSGFKVSNQYYHRLASGYAHQWDGLIDRMIENLEKLELNIIDFHSGDVAQWIKTLPADMPLLCYPPFWADGYDKSINKYGLIFDWDKPVVEPLDDDQIKEVIESVTNRENWLMVSPVELPKEVIGVTHVTFRKLPLFVYASSGENRVHFPRLKIANSLHPRLTEEDVIGHNINLIEMTLPEFEGLRAQYLNPLITPAKISRAFGIMVDDKLIGVFGVNIGTSSTVDTSEDSIFMMSDFPMRPTKYRRLSKLVLYACLSREMQIIAERMTNKRCRYMKTTAFSDQKSSMKYRGLFEVSSRFEQDGHEDDETIKHWRINYKGRFGRWSLADGLAEWRVKHKDS